MFTNHVQIFFQRKYKLIYIYIYQLSVSRTTDKSEFSISRTYLGGLVGFVSSYMLN